MKADAISSWYRPRPDGTVPASYAEAWGLDEPADDDDLALENTEFGETDEASCGDDEEDCPHRGVSSSCFEVDEEMMMMMDSSSVFDDAQDEDHHDHDPIATEKMMMGLLLVSLVTMRMTFLLLEGYRCQ